jgi:hypothetical protein
VAKEPGNGIQRLLGSLEAQIASNTSAVANLTTRWERQDERAEDGRRLMHQKIDDVKGTVTVLSGQVIGVTQEIAEMRNDVDDIEGWRSRLDNERTARDARRKVLDRISGKVWAVISGFAMLAGGGLAALTIELAKRYL